MGVILSTGLSSISVYKSFTTRSINRTPPAGVAPLPCVAKTHPFGTPPAQSGQLVVPRSSQYSTTSPHDLHAFRPVVSQQQSLSLTQSRDETRSRKAHDLHAFRPVVSQRHGANVSPASITTHLALPGWPVRAALLRPHVKTAPNPSRHALVPCLCLSLPSASRAGKGEPFRCTALIDHFPPSSLSVRQSLWPTNITAKTDPCAYAEELPPWISCGDSRAVNSGHRSASGFVAKTERHLTAPADRLFQTVWLVAITPCLPYLMPSHRRWLVGRGVSFRSHASTSRARIRVHGFCAASRVPAPGHSLRSCCGLGYASRLSCLLTTPKNATALTPLCASDTTA